MPTWQFTNVTRSFTFHVRRSSFSISDARPCELATLAGTVDDLDEDMVFEGEDEVRVTETPDGGSAVTVFAGDITKRTRTDHGGGEGPRVYRITAQDFTARLDDDVVTGNRTVRESAQARVAWIMGYGTRGVTSGAVQAIATQVDPFDYRGMSVRAALAQVAQLVGALFYVDFSKSLHFFTSELNPAPFDLVRPAVPPTSYPYTDFSLDDETPDLAHAVYVKGDGVETTRLMVGAPAAPARQTRALVDPNIKTLAEAQQAGDVALTQWSTPIIRGQLKITQPGLQGGMTVRISHPAWGIDATFRIASVQTSLPAPRRASYAVSFADRIVCRASAGDVAAKAITLPSQVLDDVTEAFADLSIAGANLIKNSSFEKAHDWTSGSLWSVPYASTTPFHGTYTARVAPTGTDAGELVTTDYIAVKRTDDYWFSFSSLLSARTAGTARVRIREYNSSNTLLQSTDIDLTAVETTWTRHSRHFGPDTSDDRVAFHANTVKVKIAVYTTGSATLTWEVDAFQLERSAILTAYAPAPYEILQGSITETLIADDSISTPKLQALAVVAGKIAAAAITAEKIASAAVETDKLAAKAVTADKIVVGDFTNLVENPGGEAGDDLGWTVGSGWDVGVLNAAQARTGQRVHLRTGAGSSDATNILGFSCVPGDRFFLRGYVKASGAIGTGAKGVRVNWYDGTGTLLSSSGYTTTTSPTSWTVLEGVVTAPAAAVLGRVALTITSQTGGTFYVDDVLCTRLPEGLTNAPAEVVIDAAGITITNGKLTVTNPAGTVIIDGTSDMWRIAASGSITVPRNSVKGDVFKTVDINTGITVNPYTMWAVESASDSTYRQPTPEVLHNLSGQVLRYYTGMAKHIGGGITRVRGLKGTTRPPVAALTYKYWVLEQESF